MSRKKPYLPLFIDDYEAATTHLSLEEDGAYSRLLRLQWRTPKCKMPNDTEWLIRRLRIDVETFGRVIVPLLKEFFKTDGNYVFNSRLLKEFKYKRRESDLQSARVKSRWDKEKEPYRSDTARYPSGNTPNPTHTIPDKEERLEARVARAPKKGTRLPSDWTLPSEWRDWALSEGRDLDIDDQALRFRDYWVAKPGAAATKLDWLATWRNWIRNAKPGYGKGNEDGLDRAFRKIRGEVRNGNSGVKREASAEVLPAEAICGPRDICPDDHLSIHALFRDDSHDGD